jgi:type II secretory pathway pseudopilin PulG
MSATAELELAPIEATRDSPLTLADLAVRPLSALEPTLLALSARYERVAFDLKTPKGLTDAKAARHDLRANGRYLVQNARDGFKKDAEAAKRAVEAEAERLIGLVKPREDALDTDIRNREAEIEAEKAEKARIERERVEALQAGVARLLSYSDRAIGQPAEKIAQAVAALEAMTFPEERWHEFAGRADEARRQTVAKLLVLHSQALEADRLRAENERLQAEAAQRAERERAEAARLAAIRQAEDAAAAAVMKAVADANQAGVEVPPAVQEAITEVVANMVIERAANTVTTPDSTVSDDATGEVLSTVCPATAAPEVEKVTTPADDEPALKLGDLCARLGFTMTESFVRDTLQIQPVPSKGRAVLIAHSSLPELRDSLIARIHEVLGPYLNQQNGA